MNYALTVFLYTFGLFIGMLALLDWGRRIGKRRIERDGEGASAGSGVVEGAIFALMGLLVAFTFSGAASRFDHRRDLIVEEANAIGTAYLRIDLLEPAARDTLKELFRRYLDYRLETYKSSTAIEVKKADLAESTDLQAQIWDQAIAACRVEGNQPVRMLLLPAINSMIDITTTRTMAAQTHPPTIIYAMLFIFTLAGSLLAGFGMATNKTRNWAHMLVFACTLSFAVYVILDLEYPRLGLIRIDYFDQALIDVRASMK